MRSGEGTPAQEESTFEWSIGLSPYQAELSLLPGAMEMDPGQPRSKAPCCTVVERPDPGLKSPLSKVQGSH
jgi:hypothetical protein